MDDFAHLSRIRPHLQLRRRSLNAIRRWLDAAGFLEIDTPVRIPAPALEDYIEAEASGDRFLRTSPELHMKRLLAAGYEDIYQIGPCFRQGERGPRHLPEFTMLEWYRAGACETDILNDFIGLMRHVCGEVTGSDSLIYHGQNVRIGEDWEILTVEDAFRLYAQADLDAAIAAGDFEEILVTRIEPKLGCRCPTILSEYPDTGTGLSQTMPGRPGRTARWEAYIGGLELANACAEITDPVLQRRNFERTTRLRAEEGRTIYPLDEEFLAALEHGLPSCAGIAVGIDRLIMLLANADTIADVVAFAQ